MRLGKVWRLFKICLILGIGIIFLLEVFDNNFGKASVVFVVFIMVIYVFFSELEGDEIK